jgi:hypothetical protein
MYSFNIFEMKKLIVIVIISAFFIGFSGCRKYLNVTPIDNLAGNDFWKTKGDVESFTLGIYNKLRTVTNDSSRFFPATGDLRCAPINTTSEHAADVFVGYLRNNDLNDLLSNNAYLKPETTNRFWEITEWNNFYAVVQEANIMYDQVAKMPASALSVTDKNTYQAEAVFLRSLCYFMMVRIYGDVPYYTDSFNASQLARTNKLTVLKNCFTALAAIKDNLPWTYTDAASVATRAMRGSAIILMMHINMWEAGFDAGNAQQYYTSAASLGSEIMTQNGGAYALLPIQQSYQIFRGGSKEGLFEIVQVAKTSEQFFLPSVYSNYVLHMPFNPYTTSDVWYDVNFMQKLYPAGGVDLRETYWFDANIYASDGSQQMLKFINAAQGSTYGINQVGNQIIFRYADAILLTAEALADLGQYSAAQADVNLIRARAGAPAFNDTGQQLQDDIYWERVRELMGEGHYFYDLVRTRKAIDGNYSYSPISLNDFNNGAWTWPIDVSALNNDPKMTLNPFWTVQ